MKNPPRALREAEACIISGGGMCVEGTQVLYRF
jgi:hypothetical protein